ncbi:MAG TPA: hypothetical protein VN285_05975 [Candidatus Deferrimicrobium sp.]|nr:hypothetical protein [Candidatus Deferrimicrobium sp.]
MLDGISSQLAGLWDKVARAIEEHAGFLQTARDFILEHFGSAGLVAACVVAVTLFFLVLWQLTKLSFATVKYLILPAVILAGAGSLLLPYSFFNLLPITITACSLLLLFMA